MYTPKFQYTKLNQVTRTDGFRTYGTPSGIHPSVTTILDATSDKSGLIAWRERVGEEEANRIVKAAVGLGGLMHKHLEDYMMGLERPSGTNHVRIQAKKMADVVIEHGLCHVDEIWGIESPLYYPGLYAGTADLVGVFDGSPAIMDYKTARKMKTSDMIENYFLQGAAYLEAHNEVYNTNIDTIVIFMVDREFNFQKFVIKGKRLEDAKRKWLNRLDYWYNEIQPTLDGVIK